MAGTKQTVSFAIHAAYIAAYGNGESAATWVQIPLIKEGTINLSLNEAEVTDGEGVLHHLFYHTQRARGTLRCARDAMRVIELITGNGSSSALGTEEIVFGTDAEIQPPLFRLMMVAKAEDESGNEGYFAVYGYKARGRMTIVQMADTQAAEYAFDYQLFRSNRNTDGDSVPEAYGKIQFLRTTEPTAETS